MGEDVDLDPRPLVDRLAASQLSTRSSLTELSAHLRFFSLAPLITLGRLRNDPVADWENEHGHRGESGAIVLEKPILSLDLLPSARRREFPPVAQHVLSYIAVELWPELWQYLGGLAGINRRERYFWRAFAQLVPVPDHRFMNSTAGQVADHVVTVPVALFGLDSTEGLYCWDEPLAGAVPALRYRCPEEETLLLAAQHFQNDEKRP